MNQDIVRKHRTQAWIQTLIPLTAVAALSYIAARILFGPTAALIALGVVVAMTMSGLSRAQVLLPAGSRRLSYFEAPELVGTVQKLSQAAGLNVMPEMYLAPSPAPNAFTTGSSDQPVIVITDTLLRRLSGRELTGVLAHEIAHIRNRDLYLFALSGGIQRMGQSLAGVAGLLLFFALPAVLFTASLAPLLGVLLLSATPFLGLAAHTALMRAREFAADLTASELTGDPKGLASALLRLEQRPMSILEWFMPRQVQHQESGLGDVFRSHPPTQERVRRLNELMGVAGPTGRTQKATSGYRGSRGSYDGSGMRRVNLVG